MQTEAPPPVCNRESATLFYKNRRFFIDESLRTVRRRIFPLPSNFLLEALQSVYTVRFLGNLAFPDDYHIPAFCPKLLLYLSFSGDRDIYKDLDALGKSVGNDDAENSRLDMFSLEMFENIAYVMAKHADPSIPDSPEEWLDEFSTFSIYQVLPKIIELWGLNVQTDVSSKKNFAQLTAK